MKNILLSPSSKTLHIRTPDGLKSFRVNSLFKDLSKIFHKARELSQEYGGNAKFPINLGSDQQFPEFIREEAGILSDVLNGAGDNYTPEEVLSAVTKIKTIGRSAAAFDVAFYGSVARYYGFKKLSVKATKKALKEKAFKAPAADIRRPRLHEERYESYIVWLLNAIPNLKESAIKDLNIDELKNIEQNYNILSDEGIPREYLQPYERTRPVRHLRGEKRKGALNRPGGKK